MTLNDHERLLPDLEGLDQHMQAAFAGGLLSRVIAWLQANGTPFWEIFMAIMKSLPAIIAAAKAGDMLALLNIILVALGKPPVTTVPPM